MQPLRHHTLRCKGTRSLRIPSDLDNTFRSRLAPTLEDLVQLLSTCYTYKDCHKHWWLSRYLIEKVDRPDNTSHAAERGRSFLIPWGNWTLAALDAPFNSFIRTRADKINS